MSKAAQRIASYIQQSIEVKQKMIEHCIPQIEAAGKILTDSFLAGGKLLLCGNGGSAADCQHVAAEFVSRLTKAFSRPAMPAIALTTDSSFLTAFANDCGFDGIFARQVEALGKSGDVLLGISTSGSSKNVVLAFQEAKKRGVKCLALMGEAGELKNLADLAITVPSKHTQIIQESHLTIEHLLCELAEDGVYGHLRKG